MAGLLALVVTGSARAEPADTDGAEAAAEAPPTWRFRQQDRSVKLVVLAGSVGAFMGDGYPRLIERHCAEVEVENLSKTGLGAWALKKRFRDQVLKNRYLDLRKGEHWLLWAAGVNSIASPERTNRYARDTFVMAKARGFRTVAFTPSPWGAESDRRRWAGLEGLRYRRATQKVADYLMGRLTPRAAFGSQVSKRTVAASAPWQPEELPEVAVDLYDSDLRDRGASVRDVAAMRTALERDKGFLRSLEGLDPAAREQAIAREAAYAASLPRWYLRPEFRSFDHIHLNAAGHRALFRVACPALPASWRCDCAADLAQSVE